MGDFIRQQWLSATMLNAIREIEPIARRNRLKLAQFALAWVLRGPNVACAIVGATRPERVADNSAASGVSVALEDFAAAEGLISAAGG